MVLNSCRGTSKEDVVLHDGFELLIPEESDSKLTEWKEIALEQGIISDDLKEYVPAQWVHGGDTVNVEIRLKGDWTDHLENDLPSYRVKLPSGYSFKGIRTFSIQDPMTRNYAHEWFMHQLFEREEMLVTSYYFVPGLINGEGGTFALEEHFESRLLTSRGRPKGPIIKIDEGGLWEARLLGNEVEYDYPIFPSAPIKPFKKSKIAKDKSARKEFEVASNLLEIYKTNNFEAARLFDTRTAGKYFALLELGYVTHSHIWHNQRFYYNPISTKLEFIGFDMNPGHEEEKDTMIFIRQELNKPLAPNGYNLVWPFLCDADFRESYTSHLIRFSKEEFLDSVVNEMEESVDYVEGLIEKNEMYDFDMDFYRDRASVIRENLTKLDADWEDFWSTVDREKLCYNKKYFPFNAGEVLESVGLNVYQDEKKETVKLEFENYHRSSVEVIGFSSALNPETYIPLKEVVLLPAFEMFPDRRSTKVEVKVGQVYYRMKTLGDTVLRAEVMPWKAPRQEHPRFKLERKFRRNPELYNVVDGQLVFHTGELKVTEVIYVPDSLEVVIPAGTELRFKEKAGLIVNGAFQVNGEKGNPVRFEFEGKGYGVLVLNSPSVKIRSLEMKGGRGLDYKGWKTKAGLTILGSQLSISDSEFKKADADYAIQLVDCEGTFESSVISNSRKHSLIIYGSDMEFSKMEVSEIDGTAVEAYRSNLEMNTCRVEDVEEIMRAVAQSRIISKGLVRGEKVGRCRLMDGSTYSTESGFYPAAR